MKHIKNFLYVSAVIWVTVFFLNSAYYALTAAGY